MEVWYNNRGEDTEITAQHLYRRVRHGRSIRITRPLPMRLALFAVLLACSFTLALAQDGQTQSPPSSQVTNTDLSSVTDVRQLFGEREMLIKQLRDLEQDIAENSEKIHNLPPANTLQQDLQKFSRDLENAQKATPPDQQRIDALKRAVENTNDSLQTVNNSAPILRAEKADQDQKRQRLIDVEQRIASLFDATRDTNRFRSGATWAFTGLVLVVVGGFFFIAYRKDGIAAKIFGGEMGMQFVTLFLIVIAIILFGIMGTLEGRELAALLGGLSGYILGKTGLRRDGPASSPTDTNTNANPNATANP